MVDYDDRLQLRNETTKPLVSATRASYFAFRDGHVYCNSRSPATDLNDDLSAASLFPGRLTRLRPLPWRGLARQEFDWHDHRIH